MNGSKSATQWHLEEGWLAISQSISLSLATNGAVLNITTNFVSWMAQLERAAKGHGGMPWVLFKTSTVVFQDPLIQYTRWTLDNAILNLR